MAKMGNEGFFMEVYFLYCALFILYFINFKVSRIMLCTLWNKILAL